MGSTRHRRIRWVAPMAVVFMALTTQPAQAVTSDPQFWNLYGISAPRGTWCSSTRSYNGVQYYTCLYFLGQSKFRAGVHFGNLTSSTHRVFATVTTTEYFMGKPDPRTLTYCSSASFSLKAHTGVGCYSKVQLGTHSAGGFWAIGKSLLSDQWTPDGNPAIGSGKTIPY
jgi:hypothetical protein